MRKRRGLLGVIALLIFLISCSNISEKGKEIIIIDENSQETNNEKGDISVKLLYKVRNYGNYSNENGSFNSDKFMTIRQEEIINFTLKESKNEYFKYDILSVDRGAIQKEKDQEGFNIVNWKEDEIKGELISNLVNNNDFRIYYNDKIYNLNNDFKLQEIEAYKNINKEEIEYYIGNGKIDVISNESKYEIIDLKEDKYYKIDNIEEILENQYLKGDVYENHNILSVDEDKIYLVLRDKNEEGKMLFKIGYIENNKFHVILDKERLEIEAYSEYGIGRGEFIMKGNNLLFFGIINETRGIWNYNILSNEIKLEMETKEKSVASINISPDNSQLIISIIDIEENEKEEPEVSFGFYIGNLDDNLEISNITNITIGDRSSGYFKLLEGFSEDGKRIYIRCYDYNGEVSKEYFEIYEIVD